MAVKQKAIGVQWGISSTGYTYTGAATVLAVVSTGQSYKKMADLVELKDKLGEVNGLVFFNYRVELTLRVYPSAGTLALAKSAGGTMGLAVGDKFSVSDADDPDIAGSSYVVIDCGKEKTNDNITTFEVTVREYAVDVSADTA